MGKNCGSFFGGLVLGAAIGAGLALLYAPTTGREARKILRKKALEAKKKAFEARDKMLEGYRELKEKAKEETGSLARRAKKAVREFKREA